MVRFYLPAFALFLWALAAAAGADPTALRILGPALTGAAVTYHIREEVRRHRGR